MTNKDANRFFFWHDIVIYLGDSFETSSHRHHAVQCCIALTGKLEIRWEGLEQWEECTAAVIGANVRHSMRCLNGLVCLIYLEKSSSLFKTILEYQYQNTELQKQQPALLLTEPFPADLKRMLLDSRRSSTEPKMTDHLKTECLKFFGGYISSKDIADPRIVKLLNLLNAQPRHSFSGHTLAQKINLSQSRMQHLFKQQLGLPIRRYMLWLKLRCALKLAFDGQSLTESAHSVGFSDSAHFSRVFKLTFGISPSLLLKSRSTPIFCE